MSNFLREIVQVLIDVHVQVLIGVHVQVLIGGPACTTGIYQGSKFWLIS